MKITIIYDNTAFRKDLQPDWGFSALIEAKNTPKILFDTGASGSILLSNMEKIDIDPKDIDEIFISHTHFDHMGGLRDFLKVNNQVKIYIPGDIPSSYKELIGAKEVISIKEPFQIHENVFSTGELEGIEQSMGIKTEKGIVLIVGCSHPYMGNILNTAKSFGKLYAIIGGMHGFSEFELFKDLELICPTHCTQHKAELKKLYSQKYIEGGAGRIIEI